MVPSTGALTHNEGAFVEAVLMKWLARVSSLSLLLFKVHFIINVGEKEMIPFVSLHERNKEPCSPRARTVTYLSYSTLFHWGSSIFNLSMSLPSISLRLSLPLLFYINSLGVVFWWSSLSFLQVCPRGRGSSRNCNPSPILLHTTQKSPTFARQRPQWFPSLGLQLLSAFVIFLSLCLVLLVQ